MEQLKVKKKDIIITNVIIYLCLSFFFLYIQHAYRHHISPFSWAYIRKGIELFWYVALVLGASALSIWRHHPASLLMYRASIFLVGFKVIEGLFIEFNKIIVIAMFFYAIISYFLYQLLSYYLSLASINANYSSSDLFEPLLKKIPCVVSDDGGDVEGYLSNWDFEGCFVKLNAPKKLVTPVTVKIFFKDREFKEVGEVVAGTPDFSGIGIRFEKTAKDLSVFNWTEFMVLVQELGFQPKRLR
jgi:hypothetical protein